MEGITKVITSHECFSSPKNNVIIGEPGLFCNQEISCLHQPLREVNCCGAEVHSNQGNDMIETCPKCGGTAILVQFRDDFEEIPDLGSPTGKVRLPIKVEEFRCQEQSCEHEFEKIIREPTP